MQWSPPRKYKGFRTSYIHAYKVTIKAPCGTYTRFSSNNSEYYTRLAEMEEWCEEFCTRNWSSGGYTHWYFDKATEAVMFKMIFGGK